MVHGKQLMKMLRDYPFFIYLQLQNNASSDFVAKKISQLFIDKKGGDIKSNFFSLQSLQTLHLIGADGNSTGLQMVRIFS